jgi:hypothetical protein
MGMDLISKGGSFRLSHGTWRADLELAHEHEWEPAGTEPPKFTAYAAGSGTVDELRTRGEGTLRQLGRRLLLESIQRAMRTPPTSRIPSSVPWAMCPMKAAGAIS